MKLLLDTHTFIWYITDSPKLSERSRNLISDSDSEIILSIASVWEMAIKQSTGKLSLGVPFREFIEHQLSANSIKLQTINLAHIDVVATLPLHHRDPFDRMIIAQAIVEQIPILSRDYVFDSYRVTRLW
ncbi:MAG: type II toxin-antitoxin system VapC family toxin [Hormoscilla sp.]